MINAGVRRTAAAKHRRRLWPPRLVAAVVIAVERVLLGVLRSHLLRGSSAAVTRRALRRDCDRAFAVLDAGITSYGARPGAS